MAIRSSSWISSARSGIIRQVRAPVPFLPLLTPIRGCDSISRFVGRRRHRIRWPAWLEGRSKRTRRDVGLFQLVRGSACCCHVHRLRRLSASVLVAARALADFAAWCRGWQRSALRPIQSLHRRRHVASVSTSPIGRRRTRCRTAIDETRIRSARTSPCHVGTARHAGGAGRPRSFRESEYGNRLTNFKTSTSHILGG